MLFVSHKTEDKAIANEILRRFLERGYSDKQIFLDSDPGSGIEAGTAWERKIYESLKHTRAMIVLCSPNWLKSQWCFVELGYAKAMAISVFPIVIEKCDVGSTLSATQAIDLTTGMDSASRNSSFDRLWAALEEQHLGPKDNLPWPPPGEKDNCPFPGLMYFDEKDAPVFYGREQERDTVIKQLKEMRKSGVPRLLMIVGGSGSGKSSLLRAGVLPRLRHPTEQHDWLVLPTLRYGETPNDDVTLLARLAEVIADRYPQNYPRRPDWKELRDRFEADDVEQATRDFVDATVDLCQARRQDESHRTGTSDQAPTTLLVIDQFEELLTGVARPSAQKFLRFLRNLLLRSNGRLLVIGTMRSDYLDTYEHHAESLKPPFLELYRLPPFMWDRVTEVIVKPAERVDVTFSEELITRLKGDAPNSDALPLLAFTLEKLFRKSRPKNVIVLDDYLPFEKRDRPGGGMTEAISQAVSRILPRNMPKETEHALRLSFVRYLAQVNDKDEIVRLTAHWSDIPHIAHPVLKKFVTERLLVKYEREGQVYVEVAHEALFRGWDTLKDWLRTSADILRWRRDVGRDQTGDGNWTSLTPAQLAVARHWPRQRRDELTEDEVKWISSGIFRERFRRGVVGTVIFVISVLAALAWWQKTEADKATNKAVAATSKAVAETSRAEAETSKAEAATSKAEAATSKAREAANAEKIAKEAAKSSEIMSRIRLAESEIQQGQLARGIFSYWQAYEGARIIPDDLRPQSARSLIGFLSGQLGQPMLHNAAVNAVAFSRDGTTVITGCADNRARLWDVATHEPRGLPLTHEDRVVAVAFSPDGKIVLTGSFDRTARLWDARTGMQLGEPLKHQRRVLAVAFSPDSKTVLTGSADMTARLWDVKTHDPKGEPLKHEGWVNSVAFNEVGDTVLTGSFDMTARLWDARTGEPKGDPLKHDRGVHTVAFSPDGETMLTGCWDKMARLWDVETHAPKGKPLEHEGWVSSAAFSPDSKTVLTGSFDKTARLWDAATGNPRGEPMRHELWVNSVAFNSDGKTVLTGSSDKTARLWNVPSAHTMWHEDSVAAVAFSQDGDKVLTGSWDKHARLWDAATGELLLPGLEHDRGANAVAFSQDGERLLTGSYDKNARLWNAVTGELQQILRVDGGMTTHDEGVTTVAFSPDGKTVVTASYDQTALLWDAETGKLLLMLKGVDGLTHLDGVIAAVFNRDGDKVLTGGEDKTARLWDVATGKLTWTLQGSELVSHRSSVMAVALSPDGDTVLTGSYDGTARLWDAHTGNHKKTLAHQDWVTSVAFSHDSKRVLTGSFDGTARVWDAATGLQWGEPLRHEGPVFAVAFSPKDDSIILTGSRDKTARIWTHPPIPAADEPTRLRLSVEVRTTYTLDSKGDRTRLTHAEWLKRRQELTILGGRCDVRNHAELSAAEVEELNRRPIE